MASSASSSQSSSEPNLRALVLHSAANSGHTPDSQEVNPSSPIGAVEKNPSRFKQIISKIWTAIKWVFKFALGCALFISNPSFFAVGFVAGVVFSDKIQEAINKIKEIWKKQPWGVALLVAAGAFLALPVTLATASFFYGGSLGAGLSQKKEGEQAEGQASS